jgi:Phage tail sheath C-terminal domain
MAILVSPGVDVTITDQSQYLPSPTNSVPLVVVATAQNKADGAGTAVAPATTAANAGKLYLVTSQRDLVNLYGTPFFYTTTNGTPIQGYELNEYGLLAAYSSLGVTNRCYVLRADIDLASLVGLTSRPTGTPANNTYWLNTTTSTWGINEFNASTGQFELQTPIVISDMASTTGGMPLNTIGNIGQYAVNAIMPDSTNPFANSQYFYKTSNNEWVVLGSTEWLRAVPAVIGTNTPTTLTPGDAFYIAISGTAGLATITVPAYPNNTTAGVAAVINSFNWAYLSADTDSSGHLLVYLSHPEDNQNNTITFTNKTNTPLAQIGITAGTAFYQPAMIFGTPSQMPLWTSSQTTPRPSGSIWVKVTSSTSGLNPVVSRYNATSGNWNAKTVTMSKSDWNATATLDSTGGQAIPAGTIYAQYAYDGPNNPLASYNEAPIFVWERTATGPTVATATNTNWTLSGIPSGSASIYVLVSEPGSNALSSSYTVGPLYNGDQPIDFVTAWQSAGIPYTSCTLTTDGAIQLVHTEGGEIVMSDWFPDNSSNDGKDSTIFEQVGFLPDVTTNVKYGISNSHTFNVGGTGGTGTGFQVSVQQVYGQYNLVGNGVYAAGTGYTVGDNITIPYTSLGGTSSANNLVVRVVSISGGGGTGPVASVTVVSGVCVPELSTVISNWVPLTYTANEGAPVALPANNRNWFYAVADQVDIMVNYGGQWNGYRNLNYDSSGFPSASGSNSTDPNGPIVSASAPTTQSDGTDLAYGDIWIDTSDLNNYPLINRWQAVGQPGAQVDQWVRLDNADQTSSAGVAFLDARWSTSGAINPVDDPIPTIKSMLTSDYIDLDAPSPSTYPAGMLLFNTRRSGNNVKEFKLSYFTSTNYPDAGAYDGGDPTNTANLPEFPYTWVSVSGNKTDGSPYMGRQAQRIMVVKAMKSVVDTNNDIRDEDNYFNLMAAPYYPELQSNMVALNNTRGQTGYIIGDTPMRLPNQATDIQAYATSQPADGGPVRDTYLGLFYPSGLTNDLSGNTVAVPPSHMMLRTFLRNDTISYPWLAAAGTRRGTIDNADGIGYLDATTGEFIKTKTQIGIRDVLYTNFINPLVFFTGVGLLNYGNKNSKDTTSAQDRTNVARLCAYIRRQLTLAARPFVFEPNDALTRNQISGVVQTLLVDLVAKRGIYDYLVVCDESNNTPARIDANQLWIDVAIEPVKAAEFIYIPVRVLNTGEIANLK